MAHHYLGTTPDGRVVSRKSNNPNFTHAAIIADPNASPNCLPNFSTSAAGALRNFDSYWNYTRKGIQAVVVELRKVDSAEFRAATKGIDPRNGRKA